MLDYDMESNQYYLFDGTWDEWIEKCDFLKEGEPSISADLELCLGNAWSVLLKIDKKNS